MRIFWRNGWAWVRHGKLRKPLGTQDEREAKKRADVFWRQAADPSFRPTDETTIALASDVLITEKRRKGRAEGTIKMLTCHTKHFRRLWGGHLPLGSLDAKAVDRYVARREAEGAEPHTIHKELSTLRGLLKSAKRRNEFAGDIAAIIPQYDRKWTPGTRALTSAELLRLLAVLPADRRALCAFIVATAADLSSAIAARKTDVELATWRVRVRGTKTSKRARVVPVALPFRDMLREAYDYLPFRPWGNVRRDLEVACGRAEVPRVTPRDLRRTCSSILRNEYGVAPQYLAAVLGHADSRMVELVYGRLEVDALEKELGARTARKTKARKAG